MGRVRDGGASLLLGGTLAARTQPLMKSRGSVVACVDGMRGMWWCRGAAGVCANELWTQAPSAGRVCVGVAVRPAVPPNSRSGVVSKLVKMPPEGESVDCAKGRASGWWTSSPSQMS